MTIIPILVGGFGNRLYQIANAFRLQDLYGSNLKFYKINTKHLMFSNLFLPHTKNVCGIFSHV